jgi:hypothetical protein
MPFLVSLAFGGWSKFASLVFRNVPNIRSRSDSTVAGRVETVVTSWVISTALVNNSKGTR